MLCISNIFSFLSNNRRTPWWFEWEMLLLAEQLIFRWCFWRKRSIARHWGWALEVHSREPLSVCFICFFFAGEMRSFGFLLLPPCLLLTSKPPNLDGLLSLWNDTPNITAAEKYPTLLLGYFHFTKFVCSVPVNMDVQISITST